MKLETDIGVGGIVLLIGALVLALGFEFVNGFHDTANAVATVIYTRSLKPIHAVIWSGCFNFLGVAVGGVAVAMSILKLLPPNLLAGGGGLAMVLALLSAAILWNLGTWYFALPASSSHTLIGAIIGVGVAASLRSGHGFGDGVEWRRVGEAGLSLLISPVIGFVFAGGLVLAARRLIRKTDLHEPAHQSKPPPGWIRAILVSTCSGVSFAHGSNDGQKGIGLIMLILIGLLPADFAINRSATVHAHAAAVRMEQAIRDLPPTDEVVHAQRELSDAREILGGPVAPRDRLAARDAVIAADAALARLPVSHADRAELRKATDYAPTFVLLIVAMALGLGTMVGWKRIVTTIGEGIGKTHLSYAQGASAELVAMATIGVSAAVGLPVSTTHVLSSGVAGTMVAQGSGLKRVTVRNIALAWVLTLPVSMVLAGLLFLAFRLVLRG